MAEYLSLDSLSVSLSIAFIFGMGARLGGMPPMLGFLLAGFALSELGVEPSATGRQVAAFGVLLLLFIVGLKLKPQLLTETHVLGGALGHMVAISAVMATLLGASALTGLAPFATLDPTQIAVLAFALSFSSTVFAVKVFEEKGELTSVHGKTALGILILQDIAAVVFMTTSTGVLPSPWAIGLIGLLALRPIMFMLLDRMGHGELLPLFGLVTVLVLGAALFKAVGLKPDLGALVIGMLLAAHRRSPEIADSLLAFKDIFLIGFFLNIGLSGLPDPEVLLSAIVLLPLLALKGALFFFILCGFRLRARTAVLAALGLGTFSEFGLIVGAVAVDLGLLDQQWLLVLAIALALSFMLATPLNAQGHSLYARFSRVLRRFEAAPRTLEDPATRLGRTEIVIFGMGRLGTAVYDALAERIGSGVTGIETDREKVAKLEARGMQVIHGDATDSDFWERAGRPSASLRAVLLAMPDHDANMYALKRIRAANFRGHVAAMARFSDEIGPLREAGADLAFDVHREAGTGFADDIVDRLDLSTVRNDHGARR